MIYVIRHGQTDQNQSGLLQGRSNTRLNENGVRQAEKAGEYFRSQGIRFDRCYSSPLDRAVKTAKIVTGFSDDEIVKDDLLLEMDYGPYEGISLKNPPKEIVTFFSDFIHNPAPKGMEPLSHVVERGGKFIEKLDYRPGENILISAHAISMKGILEYLTPKSQGSYWNKYIGNCGIYVFERKEGHYTVPEEVKL